MSHFLASIRFGLGPKAGDVKTAPESAREFVVSQLDAPETGGMPELTPSARLFQDIMEFIAQKRMETRSANQPPGQDRSLREPTKPAITEPVRPGSPDPENEGEGVRRTPPPHLKTYFLEIEARANKAFTTATPFVERLVWFWSNHFCISAKERRIRILAGAYEREAIRPHVLGNFADMLRASITHPAMLLYLNGQTSIGPNSPVGLRRGRGLNENHARELLELHTLGVDGGYTQQDVTALAKALTGWRIAGEARGEDFGRVFFARGAHEPPPHSILGTTYRFEGARLLDQIVADLSEHPATARHVARRMATHFISQPPPEDVVAALSSTFTQTGGDLKALARTLAMHDLSWSEPRRKTLPPWDFIIAANRLCETRMKGRQIFRIAKSLGQAPWEPPSPAGWPEDNLHWASSDAILERLDWATTYAATVARRADALRLAGEAFGDALSADTDQSIKRAESRQQALALLLMSPELQMR